MVKSRWLDSRQARAWRGYLHMRTLLDLQISRDLDSETDLSDAEYSVLVVLSESAGGRLRMMDLGAQLHWSHSRLSHQLSRMQKRGLVRRDRHGENDRAIDAVLTDHGQHAIERAAPVHVASVRRHFVDLLTRQEIDTLGDIADKVTAHLTEEQGVRPDSPYRHRSD